MMGNMSYTQLGRRRRRVKGFRLNSGRFSVLRLRLRFFGLLSRCFESMRRGICWKSTTTSSSSSNRRCSKSSSRRGLVFEAQRARGMQPECKPARSNSFYAEAIADCLEFIKRTSVSVDGGGSVTGR